ncbi:MAG TPA: ABC transporter substrate-binding protein [Candidatus Binatia bacterium]|jgi:ABC-type nitrate/sulfonate/bicarbonate transport system substrate-binding protein
MKHVLIATVMTLSFLCSVAHGADKIRVGVPQQVVHWMVFPLAQQKGFFKEEGFDAEIVRITGPSGRSALMSGDIDYYTTIAFIVQSAIAGLPVKVVAAYVTCPPFVLMTRPEFKSAQDLKGKTMGIGAPPGSSPDVIGKLSLRHLGLNPDRDVKFVYLNSHERTFLALEQGLYAAGLIAPPFDFQGKKLGFNSLARADELLTYPEDGLIATVKKIKEKSDEVKRVIRAGIKANRYIRSQRDGTIQFLMNWQKVDRETASANYDSAVRVFNEDGGLSEAGLRLIVDEAKKTAKIEREIPLNEIADLSMLREAQKELGIKPK